MKRVCLIRYSYYPEHNHVRRDAETLLANGYDVDVICLKDKGQKARESFRGVNVYRLPLERQRSGLFKYIFKYLAFSFLVFWKLTWLSLKRRYRVVEIDSPPDFIVFACVVPKLLRSKVILYVFDHTPAVFADNYSLDIHNFWVRFLQLIEKLSAFWADHVIVVNALCKKIIEEEGVSSSKVSVILNVPDDSILKHQASYASNERNGFLVITHGSLLYRYGVQTLIRGVPLLIREISGLHVEVMGDGEYRPQLEELARSLGVEDYVHFTGMVPFNEVIAHITQAHLGVVSIIVSKNPMLPNKLFEYLALGKPAVVSSIPAIKTYFDENSVAFYEPDNEHDLARCILDLYRNPAKRAALATSGFVTYQKYHWSVMKHEYLNVFDKLTKNKRPEI